MTSQPILARASLERVRVAQIGCGAWGRNLLRELSSNSRVDVALVVDPRDAARDTARLMAPGALLADAIDALDEVQVDAVIVATPGPLHAVHARDALARGLHVFVEKPMTTSVADALLLQAVARERGVVGMVGHLLHHHPAASAMLAAVRSGRLGRPIRIRSNRASILGSREVDGSLLWSLAPHDLSMIRAIDPSPMRVARVDVHRSSTTGAPLEATLHVETAAGLSAHVALSRASDRKMRRICVECERGTVTFDDVASAFKVSICTRRGDVEFVKPAPYDPSVSPLRAEIDAFVGAVCEGGRVMADFAEGVDVVRVIEAAEAMRPSVRPAVSPSDRVPLSSPRALRRIQVSGRRGRVPELAADDAEGRR